MQMRQLVLGPRKILKRAVDMIGIGQKEARVKAARAAGWGDGAEDKAQGGCGRQG